MCPSQEGSYPLPGTQTCCHLCLGAPMVINHHQHRNPIEEEVQEMLNTDCQQMSTSALWSFGLPAMTVRRCQHDAALGWPPWSSWIGYLTSDHRNSSTCLWIESSMIAQIFAMATCIVRVSLQQQYKSSKSYTWECDQLRIRQCGDQMIEVEPCPMSNVQWPMSSVNLWLRALLSSGQDYYQGLATLFKSNNDKIIRTGSLSEATW